eukprot:CAMPEP_0180687156 /NCGR_PEP_ID=MMETSP1037_2-20121125/73317_1 /TAXON_ID=632150 /ORGANISM="Azadinium spinosum, Strain 3D9" /LENGTH=60 /DNA_ID=CAMNT_0022717951 /DNA_START=9 /DNA_END=188 /DNA_ORIENTATION=+
MFQTALTCSVASFSRMLGFACRTSGYLQAHRADPRNMPSQQSGGRSEQDDIYFMAQMSRA